MESITLRRANSGDQARLVDHNQRMAWETEQKKLEETILTRGVAAVLADPLKGFYLVAEVRAEVVGQLMITTEWSDWRNAWFWWIQSVYVRPEHRQQGVFRALFGEAERLALEQGDVIGLRLYVETHNTAARETYRRLGMFDAAYGVFEKSPL